MKTPEPQPFLSLRDATFRLGDRLVFENTSWTFHRNEQWAIIGPNGSGKTLLADALRARLPLVRGQLRYGFRPPRGLSPEESIGHVSFDDRKLEIHDTVAQSRWNSIEEDGALRVRDFLSYERVMDVNPFEVTERHEQSRPPFERRRARAISLLRIRPFLERTLLTLSNGETQRVQLARALCHPLRLLILDEPFLGLDAATREQFRHALDRLMHSSVRLLLITNRPEDLPAHVTHLMCLEKCRVVAAAPRRESDESHKPGRRGKTPAAWRRPSDSATAGSTRHAARRRIPGKPIAEEPPAENSSSDRRPARRELVSLKNITVRYGNAIILRNLNWTIEEGESWALVGPNGSGKSTLLSLIAGDHPQAYMNRIEVFGQRRGTGESIWELKKDIGWLSPELQVHFDDSITCFEVVASGFQETIGVFEPLTTHQRAAVRRLLARFDLLQSARTPLFALSTGLQRMVLLARALVKNPRLLILDEPCLGLDPAHRELLVATVDSLLRAGSVTSIYVTHRADEIPPSITRTFRLPEGIAVRRNHSPN